MPADLIFTEPKVTAVMITGKDARRYALARVAIQCFLNQTYRNSELLIINDGSESLASTDPRVREIRLAPCEGQSLGNLRNLAFEHASGEWLIQWDDDDWHAPGRITAQMAARTGDHDAAVVLCHQVRHSLVRGSAYVRTVRDGIPGTILHSRETAARYPAWKRNEDGDFLAQFPRKIVMDNDPLLYVRTYSGLNTWGERHIMRRMANQSRTHRMRDDQWRYVEEVVLSQYDKVLDAVSADAVATV